MKKDVLKLKKCLRSCLEETEENALAE